ncbi:MAG: DUF5916 domain-containing protein [Acidobacteriota bacterium]
MSIASRAQEEAAKANQPTPQPIAKSQPATESNTQTPTTGQQSSQLKKLSANEPRPITAPPSIHIPRVTQAPKLADYLEGKSRPDELKISGFLQREPQDGIPASQETTGYLSYDDKNLYVIFVCKDEPGKIRAHMNKRENTGGDDLVGITLDTFNDHRRAYLFGSNPLGVQMDGIVAEGQDDDMSFDTVWYSEGKVEGDGYVVWFAIPFKSLRFDNADVQTWGVALIRGISRNNETSFYPYVTRRIEGFTQQFATMNGLQKISPGRNIQIIPYGFFARARFLEFDPARLKTDTEFRGGLDAKMVFHDSFTLDVTINPDFSQVESDEPQVTVNQRFEVFFPEKRPFFLENAGYFQAYENLFFSRRIADPDFGARLTGKAGPWELGALAIDDRAPGKRFNPGDPLYNKRAAIGVFRLQRQLPNQSNVGLMATSRDFASSHNRVFSADGRWKLNQNWVLNGQAIQSYTKQLDGEHLSAPAFIVNLNRQGRYFQNFFNYTDRSPEFRAQLGFVPRVDIRHVNNFMSYRWRPKTGKLQSYGFNLYTEGIWNHQGDLQDWRVNLPFVAQFSGDTFLFIRRAEFADSFAGVRVREHTNDLQFSTSFLRWLSFFTNLTTGVQANFFPNEGVPYGAKSLNGQAGFTLRPSSQFSYSQLYIFDRLATRHNHLPAGESKPTVIYNNHIVRSKINYQFNRALSVRAIFDYNAVLPNERLIRLTRDKRFAADLLMTYLVNPGTALYIGYTDGYQNLALSNETPATIRRTGAPTFSTGRQFFAKMSYLLRF